MGKKICMIMTGLHSDYAGYIIHGISDQAKVLGYDLYVYTYFGFRSRDENNLLGESNIFHAIHPEEFDGFILYTRLIQDKEILDWIETLCRQSGKPFFDVDDPVLDDPDLLSFKYPMLSDREKFRQLTEHLITVHGYRKIYCITGERELAISTERLLGYRDAMHSHGIYPSPEWEYYGDFWKEYARDFADRLASGMIPMPEAIACACTSAAITLIEQLRAHHIYVPKDVAVVGYDYSFEGEMCDPVITSISFPYYNVGIKAACHMHKLLTGKIATPHSYRKEALRIGTSCGCQLQHSNTMKYFKESLLDKIAYQELFRTSGMLQYITKSEDTHDFFQRLSNFHYTIRGIHTMHYFLCDDWNSIRNVQDSDYRTTGYSDFLHVHTMTEKDVGIYSTLPITEVADYVTRYQQNTTVFFFPLHYENRVFGFVGLQFRDPCFTPDEQFWRFLEIVNNALEMLRIRQHITRFSERIRLAVIRDPLTGVYNGRGFEELSTEIFEYAAAHGERFFLLLVRAYNLSEIQGTLGYAQADQLLIQIASILSKECRGNAVCCHTRPDCFYIVASHPAESRTNAPDGKALSERVIKHFSQLEKEYGAQLEIESCLADPQETASLSQLIRQIEQAMQNKLRRQQKAAHYTQSLETLRETIYAQPAKKWTVDALAKQMVLSRAYFQHMYKQRFGVSVSSDIITARISRAKQLLQEGVSIRDTAAQCGYSSDAYFMRQFKKETGMTPSEYMHSHDHSVT